MATRTPSRRPFMTLSMFSTRSRSFSGERENIRKRPVKIHPGGPEHSFPDSTTAQAHRIGHQSQKDHLRVSGKNIRKRAHQFIQMAQSTAFQTAPQLELTAVAINVKKIIFGYAGETSASAPLQFIQMAWSSAFQTAPQLELIALAISDMTRRRVAIRQFLTSRM